MTTVLPGSARPAITVSPFGLMRTTSKLGTRGFAAGLAGSAGSWRTAAAGLPAAGGVLFSWRGAVAWGRGAAAVGDSPGATFSGGAPVSTSSSHSKVFNPMADATMTTPMAVIVSGRIT